MQHSSSSHSVREFYAKAADMNMRIRQIFLKCSSKEQQKAIYMNEQDEQEMVGRRGINR